MLKLWIRNNSKCVEQKFVYLNLCHTGKCIRRFVGIYAYCQFFIRPDVVDISVYTILRRKSLVSTDTVCNNFVRQS